jgi:hypothetical protein
MKILTPQEQKAIADAKELLREHGYFTDNLWHVDDIRKTFYCDEGTAQSILFDALTNQATFEQIWFAIDNAISSHQI